MTSGRIQSVNPATGQIVATYAEHTAAEIEHRLAKATDAFAAWRKTDFAARSAALMRVAALLRERRDELARLMTVEVGKPITASESEADKCALACAFFAREVPGMLIPRIVSAAKPRSSVRFDPIGPILAIMPWNFPFWQLVRAAAPTLMGGNVMLLKHAPNVPGCALAIESLFRDAGYPEGVFQTLLVADNAAAEKLVTAPAIRAVTLTGSERAGIAVASAAAKVLKKSVLELGGSDAFIVLGDADVETVAVAATEARCLNNGQSCIAAKRFIVVESIADRFEEAFIKAMAGRCVGDPMDRSTQVGPLARPDLLEQLDRQVRATLAAGATLGTGGRRRGEVGNFYEPTVMTGVRPGMAAFDEETFGPVAAVIRATDAGDAVRLANQSRFGLGASIWSADAAAAERLAPSLDCGSVFINGKVASDPALPFGGTKASGWGRELSHYGVEEFMNIKTVWVAE